ncbi:hypothetical protein B0H65DRAFT_545002 [Neurospora tetraspora]|uniref:Uncharacterized protein n=1 Tax=Neurospora tetraspora TaxID=94610 RepID=A0AAE0MWS7_9PEZI|nr:hypothetical protein B0H65DRAFT_545002 [Neurospora tetraspora]
MCDFFKNYYIYASCTDPGLHFYKIELDGSPQGACPRAPHERFIVKGDKCGATNKQGRETGNLVVGA